MRRRLLRLEFIRNVLKGCLFTNIDEELHVCIKIWHFSAFHLIWLTFSCFPSCDWCRIDIGCTTELRRHQSGFLFNSLFCKPFITPFIFFLTLTFQFHHLTHQVLFPEMSLSLFRKSRNQSFVSPYPCIHKVTYDLKSLNLLLFGEDICFSEGEEFFRSWGLMMLCSKLLIVSGFHSTQY